MFAKADVSDELAGLSRGGRGRWADLFVKADASDGRQAYRAADARDESAAHRDGRREGRVAGLSRRRT
ncbi:hypothetical protein [Cohnella rhizosphaerae]|uniref:Uncharacterized protein n=1 Tax=Cohnella rhizosphaerae TaxID=1457232 RepID=A0A9X4L6C0_9BACL|nr:hypothetical protein [Cohnella rhizosphaerae]MDG0814719.1 hypothetical protein [Cohnella rhizosphaerae]